MTEETAPRPGMGTAAELGANQCAVTDTEAGRCVFPAGHGRVIEPDEGEMYDHAIPSAGAWWNDAPESAGPAVKEVFRQVLTTEANEPRWTGVGAASSGIGPVQQCSSRSPESGVRCVRELGHVGCYHMRDGLRWVSAPPADDAPFGPRVVRFSELPDEAKAALGRILGNPCDDPGCPFHGTVTGPDSAELTTPRIRILPLPNSPHNPPRFVLVVDREPGAGEESTREKWAHLSRTIGAVNLILDSRSIDVPQVDGYDLG